MTRKPKPNATKYLRRVLGIPLHRSMTGPEVQRIDFAATVLEFIIKHHPKHEDMGKFIRQYNDGISKKTCYDILRNLQKHTMIHIYKSITGKEEYLYNENRYKEDLKAIRAFRQQVQVWDQNKPS